jgi:hypothetical protein
MPVMNPWINGVRLTAAATVIFGTIGFGAVDSTAVFGAAAATQRPLPATPGGTLAGTYALTFPPPSGRLCDLNLRLSNHLMYVAGSSVAITDTSGPYTGKAARQGKAYHLMIEQWSNYIAGPLTITVAKTGTRVSGQGQLTLYASGAAARQGPCTLTFTGRRSSLSVPPGAATPSTVPSTSVPSTPSTTAIASAAGPCTLAAVSAGLTNGVTTHNPPKCAGKYALAFGTNSDGDDQVVLLSWNGAAWQELDKTTTCQSGVVPQPLMALGCNSG